MPALSDIAVPDNLPDLTGRLWFDDDVLVADRQLRAKMRRSRWSPSAAQSVQSCPARWAAEKLVCGPLDPDPFDAAPVGTAVHFCLETWYTLPPEERTEDALLDIVDALPGRYRDKLAEDEVVVPQPGPELERWLDVVYERLMPIMRLEDAAAVQVAGLERKLDDCTVGGVPFIGRIDRTDVVTDADGNRLGLGVRDYKTAVKGAKSPDKIAKFGDAHGDQARLYALAIADTDGELPFEASILYTATAQEHKPELDAESLDRVATMFADTWEEAGRAASSGRFAARPSGLCGWCPLVTVCPQAETRGFTARVDSGVYGELAGVASTPPRDTPDHDLPPRIAASKPDPDSSKEDRMAFLSDLDKRFVEKRGDMLVGGSYASTAVHGIYQLAIETLHTRGVKPAWKAIDALAHTFASVVLDAQFEVSGEDSWQSGVNTRLRGSLHASLLVAPPPLDSSDQQVWREWAERTTHRLVEISRHATDLWENGTFETPWSYFTDSESVAEQATRSKLNRDAA